MADRDIVTRAGKAAELDSTDYDQNVKSHDGTVEEQTGATYTVLFTDQNKTIELNNASMAADLTAIATIHAAIDTDNFTVILINTNSADATVARNSTDTFLGGGTSITLKQNEGVRLQTDSTGAIWRTEFFTETRSATTSTVTANYTYSGTVDLTGTFQIGGVSVTSTAAELNTLDGVAATLTASELNNNDGMTAGTTMSYGDWANGTYTSGSLATSGTANTTVAHGLGTDDIDFGAKVVGSDGTTYGSVAVAIFDTSGYSVHAGLPNPSANITPSKPAAGNLYIGVLNDGATQTVTVHWWARIRE